MIQSGKLQRTAGIRLPWVSHPRLHAFQIRAATGLRFGEVLDADDSAGACCAGRRVIAS